MTKEIKPAETWIIRHKETGEALTVPSGKSSWKAKGHAKNAWSQQSEYRAEQLGVELVPTGYKGRLQFPKFDEQDVYEVVRLSHKSETVLGEATRLLTMCLGRLSDGNLANEVKQFLEGLDE